jgi:hypothetical protein
MLMKSGESWHCTNPACCLEITVGSASIEGTNPRCACGGIMKKKYTSPVFRYLDFLRLEEPVVFEPARRKG